MKQQDRITQQQLFALLQFLLEEAKRQSPVEFEQRLRSSQFDFNPVPLGNANMMEWRGKEKSLDSFSKFNAIHRWIIADDEMHFKSHFTNKLMPDKPLIIGQKINDVIHLLKGFHKRRLLSVYDVWQGVLFDHFLTKTEQLLDRDGSLKSAVNKNPVIGSPKRAAFLDSIIDHIAFDDR